MAILDYSLSTGKCIFRSILGLSNISYWPMNSCVGDDILKSFQFINDTYNELSY